MLTIAEASGPQPPRRSVGTRTPALEDSGERQRRSLENSARGKSHETQDDTKPTSFTLGWWVVRHKFTAMGHFSIQIVCVNGPLNVSY